MFKYLVMHNNRYIISIDAKDGIDATKQFKALSCNEQYQLYAQMNTDHVIGPYRGYWATISIDQYYDARGWEGKLLLDNDDFYVVFYADSIEGIQAQFEREVDKYINLNNN